MERILIESAIRAVVLALVTGAVLRIARVRSAAGHHAAWTLVLGAMVVLPVWMLWGPRASLPVSAPRWVQSDVPLALVPDAPAVVHEPTRGSLRTAEAATPATGSLRWDALAIAIYGSGMFLLLARLFVGSVRANRLIRGAVERGGHLTSSVLSVPVTVGWLQPVVILPEHWETWPAAQLDAVLAHEREHARRRDPLVQWIALVNRAVFWFHPLAWWLERRLASLAEDACDAAVLSNGHRPAVYCECLLSMARAVTGAAGARVNLVGAPMPGASLSRRIRTILEGAPPSRVSPFRLALTLSACFAASVAVMSGTPAAESAVPVVTRQSPSPAAQPLPNPVTNTSTVAPANESGREAETTVPRPTDERTDSVIEAPLPAAFAPPQQAAPVGELLITGGRDFTPARGAARTAVDQVREQEFQDVLRSDRQASELSLTAAFSYIQLNRAEYAVPITIHIAPGKDLTVGRGERSLIDFAALVMDDFGTIFLQLRDEGELRLAPGQISALATTPLVYHTSFTLLPGRYKLKVLARDQTSGRLGTTELAIMIPNLSRQRP